MRVISHQMAAWLLFPMCVSATSVAAQALAQDSGVALSRQQLVQRLRAESAQVRSSRLQRDLAATGVDRAEAAFQPQLNLSLSNGFNSQINSYEELLSRRDQADYWRKGTDASVGISQLLGTGAKVEAKLGTSKFDSNVNRLQPSRPVGVDDYRSVWSLNLTQPLARDAGSEVTLARVEVARLDTQAAEQDRQRTETTALAEALVAYYELVLASERVRVAQAKISTGVRLLEDARALLVQGRLAEIEIWEVENALGRYKAEHSAAQQGEREKSNRLKSLLMVSNKEMPNVWQATDSLPAVDSVLPALEQVMQTAFAHRQDLRRLRVSSQREGVQVMYAENQALPRVDLQASYGRNDLAFNARDSLIGMTSPTWTVGLVAQMPLGSNRQGQADIAAAMLRQQDAEIKLKSLEVEIGNEVDTAWSLYSSAIKRHTEWREIAQREGKALQLERRRLTSGRSSMRELLNREERALNAELSLFEQRAMVAQAQVVLQSAQGILAEQW